MKKCSNTKCNREFSDDMVFCPYCGTKWKPMKRVCPNPDCRFDDIPEGANFCPNCQWDLRKNASNAQSHTEKVPFMNTEQPPIEDNTHELIKGGIYVNIFLVSCVVSCGICAFAAFYSGIDILRLINGRAANPYSIIGFPLLLLALYGFYILFSHQRKNGIVLLITGEIIGGICIGLDPDHPDDLIFCIIVFGSISILQLLSIDWKSFINS